MLALTAPLRLGRPPADAKVPSLNAIITGNAAAHGALVVDLGDFGARNHVMVDRVHPTAFGQIAIAERALAVLAADGLPARISPGALISYRTTRWHRLRGDLTYAYRDLKQRARVTRPPRDADALIEDGDRVGGRPARAFERSRAHDPCD